MTFIAALALFTLGTGGVARAQQWQEQSAPLPNPTPVELEGVDIVEHLNDPLPRDAVFRDAEGATVHLGDYFDGKRPTVFVFAYHTCPMLCSSRARRHGEGARRRGMDGG